MSEADLIARSCQDDQGAWEELVRQHQEAVYRLAYLILGDAEDAKDVAQEAFIRAHRALRRFDSTRPLRPWLLSITTNLARNWRRSAGRYMAALKRLVGFGLPAASGAIDQVQREQEAQALWLAIRRLNQTDQEVIYLRYFLGLSVEETAEALNIAPGTVKSRLHRALERLEAVVAQDFPELAEGRMA